MATQTNNSNLLLSLSVFKKLYDEKLDIYKIIALLSVNYQIKAPVLLVEITKRINDNYGFEIPQAVIKTSLSKI